MERVLELWVATHILADSELHWKTYYNPTVPPTSLHTLGQSTDDGRMPIDEITNPEAYALLSSQLRAATEKRAAQLSKAVMNDLERRLLQRQRSGWFETFLVAVILLNCVERSCWLFYSWEDENFVQRVSNISWSRLQADVVSGLSINDRRTTPGRAIGFRTFCTCC